jgi:hypothetical protein
MKEMGSISQNILIILKNSISEIDVLWALFASVT